MEARNPLLARARRDAHRGSPLSLDAPLPAEDGALPCAGDDPADVVVARSESDRLRGALAVLPQRQRALIVEHYFGEAPLRVLSDDMRVSPQRVSQLHVAAIERLRRTLTTA
jgi:RNA polymerase sigma factor (sigma-70 family)